MILITSGYVWQGVGELKPSKLLYQRLETIMSVGSVIDRSNYYPISDDDILSPRVRTSEDGTRANQEISL